MTQKVVEILDAAQNMNVVELPASYSKLSYM